MPSSSPSCGHTDATAPTHPDRDHGPRNEALSTCSASLWAAGWRLSLCAPGSALWPCCSWLSYSSPCPSEQSHSRLWVTPKRSLRKSQAWILLRDCKLRRMRNHHCGNALPQSGLAVPERSSQQPSPDSEWVAPRPQALELLLQQSPSL